MVIKVAEPKRVWSKICHGPGMYMSLPESFIAEPHEFLSYFHEHVGRDDDEVAEEAYSIIDNIGYIQVPHPNFTDSWLCSRYVDFLTPYLQGVTSFELKQAVNCLVDEIEGRKGASWDRRACERFFDDRRNFVPLHFRKPNKLDWRV